MKNTRNNVVCQKGNSYKTSHNSESNSLCLETWDQVLGRGSELQDLVEAGALDLGEK